MTRLIVSLVLALALTGCASGPLMKISDFTATDLRAALDAATAQGDVVAANCYSTLLLVLKAQGGQPAPVVKGAFSAFQAARGAVADAQKLDGVASQINMGCAALFVDANFTMAKMALLFR